MKVKHGLVFGCAALVIAVLFSLTFFGCAPEEKDDDPPAPTATYKKGDAVLKVWGETSGTWEVEQVVKGTFSTNTTNGTVSFTVKQSYSDGNWEDTSGTISGTYSNNGATLTWTSGPPAYQGIWTKQ